MSEAALVRYDAMCRAIDAAYEIDEVKAIHDQAAMFQAAARVAKNVEAETRAYEIRMRAARKSGQLLKALEKAKGSAGNSSNQYQKEVRSDDTTAPKTLADLGVTKQQSSEWQKFADVPKDKFEAALASKCVRELIDAPTPVSHEALLFIGSMRDFERRGYLAGTPADFMATMTDLMLAEVYRIAPLAAAWLATIKERSR